MHSAKSKANGNYEVPIAESTQIESHLSSPRPRAKPSWNERLSALGKQLSPISTRHLSPIRAASPRMSIKPKSLNSQIYRDTQSNGLASRVVKYFEEAEAKTRPIASRTYTRPGDFPIVNLDRSEIVIKPRQENNPKVAKLGVGSTVHFNNQASTSARSMIFRTGRNYGDADNLNAEKSLKRAAANPKERGDEPIVPTISEYDANPTRSVLDALKEISRKRIHCDELDGDFMKKQRAEKAPNVTIGEPAQVAKRGRDRTSPNSHPSLGSQKKRYRNNDISSSLSSSIHIVNPNKPADVPQSLQNDRPRVPADQFSAPGDLNNVCQARPPIHGDQNRNKSAAEVARAAQKPPAKTVRAEIVPAPEPRSKPQTRTQKLTLFNKVYSPSTPTEDGSDSEDSEARQISFIKPKEKASSIFKLDKDSTRAKSKLANLLSCISDDYVDSTDETDHRPAMKAVELTPTTSASLSGGQTNVTFSTATTTSILSLATPANQPSVQTIAPQKDKPSAGTASLISTSTATTSSATSVSLGAPTVAAATAPMTTAGPVFSSTSVASPPRIGGFSFDPASTAAAPSAGAVSSNKSTAAEAKLVAAAPTFSFGAKTSPAPPNPVPSAAAPVAGGFGFGQTSKPETSSVSSAAVPNFSFGLAKPTEANTSLLDASKSASKPITATSVAPPSYSFGAGKTDASNSAANQTTIGSSAFGAAENKAASASSGAGGFSFGKTDAAAAPKFSFGAATTAGSAVTTSPTEAKSFGTLPAAPAFGALTTTPSAPALVPSIPNLPPSFAAQAATTAAASPNAAFSFGTPKSTAAAPAPAVTPSFGQGQPPAFQFGAGNTSNATQFAATNAPKTTAAPLNMFNAPTTTAAVATPPTSAFSFGAKTEPPTATNLFGSATTTNASVPVFGSSTFSAAPAPAAAAASPAPGGFSFGSNKNANASFGAPANSVSFGNVPSQASAANLFGSASAPPQSSTPTFGAPAQNSMPTLPKFGNNAAPPPAFGSNVSVLGNNAATSQANLFGGDNKSTPTFGSTAAVPTTAASGVFAFGQPAPTSTANANPNPFGASSAPSQPPSPFMFGGQSTPNTQSTPSFGAASKPSPFAFNANPSNAASTAPPAFGSGSFSSGFNFNDKPAPSFGAPTTTTADPKPAFGFNAAPVAAFSSAPANPSPFSGGNNNSSFNMGTNATDATKAFSFGATTENTSNAFGPGNSAPVGGSPFAFNAPAGPQTNAFQFNATQTPAANIFSIGPGNASNATANKGRLIRQATRRLNK